VNVADDLQPVCAAVSGRARICDAQDDDFEQQGI
jgi:hypothetical protein